jgi:two-component system sensor histidine kinase DesK
LVFLTDTVLEVAHSERPWPLRALTFTGIAVFCAAYVLAVPRFMSASVNDRRRRALVVAVFVLSTAMLPVTGASGLSLYVFVAVIAIMLLETREALAVVAVLLILSPALTFAISSWKDTFFVDLPIATASAAVFAMSRVINRNRALAEAHEELKALAVEQERARFARDLHDLLGHSLTVITVKSELAGKLLTRDPGRAATEVADIERLAREALADVRATVAGYRGVTLAAEISSARAALDAAGVSADLPVAVDDVPGERRELFGWVLREGVTNVLRHADARQVRVAVTPSSVEIVDDGSGTSSGVDGSGLAGLRERLSQVGGWLDAGPADGGGFRLYAEVPA